MNEVMLRILREAGDAIMDIYSDVNRFQTEWKADNSPLTEADKRSNDIIVHRLDEAYPGIPVISEESRQIDYQTRKDYHEYFLVDPLDGTKEFIKRNGEFTVNIAFMTHQQPSGGFVYVPEKKLAYIAARTRGSYAVDGSGASKRLQSKVFSLSDHGIKVVASRSHRDSKTEDIISSLQQPEIVSVGSSLKFLLIADGLANFYPRYGPTMEWDTAAAQCVLEEAGGMILQTKNLLPLNYNKENLLNPSFVATGALLDPESLKNMFE